MAKFDSLFIESSPEDRHGHGQDSGHQVGAVSSMAILATETLALEVGDALGNGLLPGHVVSGPGEDVGALLAGPVPGQGGDAGSLALVAETEQGADVLLQHEVVVDAAGHVSVPRVQGALAVNVGGKLNITITVCDERTELLSNKKIKTNCRVKIFFKIMYSSTLLLVTFSLISLNL